MEVNRNKRKVRIRENKSWRKKINRGSRRNKENKANKGDKKKKLRNKTWASIL